MPDAPKKATVSEIKSALKLGTETLKDFTNEWKNLPEKDKEDLRKGVGDGSMTY